MSATWAGAGRLLSDALVIQLGRALQTVLNLVTFILIARELGAHEFGIFSTIVAVIAAGAALADLGLGQLAVRAVAQAQAQEIMGIRRALPQLYAAAGCVLIVACVISWALAGIGPAAGISAALIGVSYLIVQARIGVERCLWLGALQVARATGVELVAAVFRAAAVALVWIIGGATVLRFASVIAVAGIATLVVVLRFLRYPDPEVSPQATGSSRVIGEAIPFGLSSFTWNSFVELPKLLLAPIAGPLAVGQFAAGARFLAAATLPLQSVLNVVTPRLFAAARPTGDAAATRHHAFARSVLGVTALGAAFGVATAVFAPLVPLLLGSEYVPAIPVLRLLAPTLPFQALAFAAGDWLGGLGRQTVRLGLTVGVLALAIPVLLVTTRSLGAIGAAGGFTILTGVLALATTLACWRSLHHP